MRRASCIPGASAASELISRAALREPACAVTNCHNGGICDLQQAPSVLVALHAEPMNADVSRRGIAFA